MEKEMEKRDGIRWKKNNVENRHPPVQQELNEYID